MRGLEWQITRSSHLADKPPAEDPSPTSVLKPRRLCNARRLSVCPSVGLSDKWLWQCCSSVIVIREPVIAPRSYDVSCYTSECGVPNDQFHERFCLSCILLVQCRWLKIMSCRHNWVCEYRPIKSTTTPSTFVDISAMPASFCMKFLHHCYTIKYTIYH